MAVYAVIGKEVLFVTSLILSDLHGREALFRQVLALQKRVDYLFFLGDGYKDADRLASEIEAVFVGVRGNCDTFLCPAPEEMTLDLDGVRIFLHHGHTSGVKHGLGHACAEALRREADVCLFGHTHTQYLSYEQREGRKPFYLFNPGSIASGEFGIMEIRRGEVLLSHGRL